MIYESDSRSGAGNLLTFLFGIAIGVAGTLVYAAINEEQFGRAVGKTKSLAGAVQDSVGDYIDDAGDKIKEVSGKAQDAIGGAVSKVKNKAGDVADQVQSVAKQAKSDANA